MKKVEREGKEKEIWEKAMRRVTLSGPTFSREREGIVNLMSLNLICNKVYFFVKFFTFYF